MRALNPSLRINDHRKYAAALCASAIVAFYETEREKVETYCEQMTGLNYADWRRNPDISEKEEREALLLRKKSVTANLPVFRDSVQFHF